MNNKGFTLIELLAVIVILAIVGVIGYNSVLKIVATSKERAEEKFLEDISKQIETYIELNSINLINTSTKYEFDKTVIKSGNKSGMYDASSKSTAYVVRYNDGGTLRVVTFADLISSLKMTDKFKNPKTNGVCKNSIQVLIYRDTDYVYYYYVNMKQSTNGCSASSNIDTRPQSLRSVMCSKGVTNACD